MGLWLSVNEVESLANIPDKTSEENMFWTGNQFRKKPNMKTLPLPVSDGCDQYEKAQLLLDDYHSTSWLTISSHSLFNQRLGPKFYLEKKGLEKVDLLFRVRKLTGKCRTLAAGDEYRMSGGTARLSSLRDLLSLSFGSLLRSALIADNRGHRHWWKSPKWWIVTVFWMLGYLC